MSSRMVPPDTAPLLHTRKLRNYKVLRALRPYIVLFTAWTSTGCPAPAVHRDAPTHTSRPFFSALRIPSKDTRSARSPNENHPPPRLRSRHTIFHSIEAVPASSPSAHLLSVYHSRKLFAHTLQKYILVFGLAGFPPAGGNGLFAQHGYGQPYTKLS